MLKSKKLIYIVSGVSLVCLFCLADRSVSAKPPNYPEVVVQEVAPTTEASPSISKPSFIVGAIKNLFRTKKRPPEVRTWLRPIESRRRVHAIQDMIVQSDESFAPAQSPRPVASPPARPTAEISFTTNQADRGAKTQSQMIYPSSPAKVKIISQNAERIAKPEGRTSGVPTTTLRPAFAGVQAGDPSQVVSPMPVRNPVEEVLRRRAKSDAKTSVVATKPVPNPVPKPSITNITPRVPASTIAEQTINDRSNSPQNSIPIASRKPATNQQPSGLSFAYERFRSRGTFLPDEPPVPEGTAELQPSRRATRETVPSTVNATQVVEKVAPPTYTKPAKVINNVSWSSAVEPPKALPPSAQPPARITAPLVVEEETPVRPKEAEHAEKSDPLVRPTSAEQMMPVVSTQRHGQQGLDTCDRCLQVILKPGSEPERQKAMEQLVQLDDWRQNPLVPAILTKVAMTEYNTRIRYLSVQMLGTLVDQPELAIETLRISAEYDSNEAIRTLAASGIRRLAGPRS